MKILFKTNVTSDQYREFNEILKEDYDNNIELWVSEKMTEDRNKKKNNE